MEETKRKEKHLWHGTLSSLASTDSVCCFCLQDCEKSPPNFTETFFKGIPQMHTNSCLQIQLMQSIIFLCAS